MKIQDINVGGQQVRVAIRAAADDGVPLLLINGIGASLEVLQPFVDALNPALTVIRFDVPGTGGSPLPQRPYRFSGLCKLIAALLSELGHETADVLGISWGGEVAQHFAAFQPGRCRRLDTAGPVGCGLGGRRQRLFSAGSPQVRRRFSAGRPGVR